MVEGISYSSSFFLHFLFFFFWKKANNKNALNAMLNVYYYHIVFIHIMYDDRNIYM